MSSILTLRPWPLKVVNEILARDEAYLSGGFEALIFWLRRKPITIVMVGIVNINTARIKKMTAKVLMLKGKGGSRLGCRYDLDERRLCSVYTNHSSSCTNIQWFVHRLSL